MMYGRSAPTTCEATVPPVADLLAAFAEALLDEFAFAFDLFPAFAAPPLPEPAVAMDPRVLTTCELNALAALTKSARAELAELSVLCSIDASC